MYSSSTSLLCLWCTSHKEALWIVRHTATLGCSKCLKKFSSDDTGKTDYSGYDHELWGVRSLAIHYEQCLKYLHAKTKSEHSLISKTYGLKIFVSYRVTIFQPYSLCNHWPNA